MLRPTDAARPTLAAFMLQAFELTDDKRFLDEARAAIDAAIGLRFNVKYQANLTAWGGRGVHAAVAHH